jgi:hypothetical protein
MGSITAYVAKMEEWDAEVLGRASFRKALLNIAWSAVYDAAGYDICTLATSKLDTIDNMETWLKGKGSRYSSVAIILRTEVENSASFVELKERVA